MNYQCTRTLYRLNGYFRYYCGMCTKIYQINRANLVLLCLSVVELLQNGFLFLDFKTMAKIIKH